MFRGKSNVDHFAIVADRVKAEEVMRGLGFVYGNTKKDALVHVVLEHGYFEVMDPSRLKKEPGTPSDVAGWWLGTTDAVRSREVMEKAGYDVGEVAVAKDFRRAKHGVNKGMAGFASYSFKDPAPFEQFITGVVQGLSPKVVYEQQLYIQVNGARALDAVVLVAEDEAAAKEACEHYADIDRLSGNLTADRTNARINYYITREEYRKIFGREYARGKKLDLIAAAFEGGDMVYLKEQAEELGLAYTVKGSDIYIDANEALGVFLIFHCDPMYDVEDIVL